jgi:hypothetical protein
MYGFFASALRLLRPATGKIGSGVIDKPVDGGLSKAGNRRYPNIPSEEEIAEFEKDAVADCSSEWQGPDGYDAPWIRRELPGHLETEMPDAE